MGEGERVSSFHGYGGGGEGGKASNFHGYRKRGEGEKLQASMAMEVKVKVKVCSSQQTSTEQNSTSLEPGYGGLLMMTIWRRAVGTDAMSIVSFALSWASSEIAPPRPSLSLRMFSLYVHLCSKLLLGSNASNGLGWGWRLINRRTGTIKRMQATIKVYPPTWF
ncbi:hypothetical protein L7F22_031124 [Adiantum nelumboides]|nr:hypothetical protein [Adiantum nelumboides]